MTKQEFQAKHLLTDAELLLLEKIIKLFKGKIIRVQDIN